MSSLKGMSQHETDANCVPALRWTLAVSLGFVLLREEFWAWGTVGTGLCFLISQWSLWGVEGVVS